MSDRRIFPRISTDWAIYLFENEDLRKIGYISNISLSGVKFWLINQDELDPDSYEFTLKLKSSVLDTKELAIEGIKRWATIDFDSLYIGLELQKLEKKAKQDFIRCLSRHGEVDVTVVLQKRSDS